MAPYLDCISQGVSTVMASYSSWNGSQLHSHRDLLTEVLKNKLGFKVNIPYNLPLSLSVKDLNPKRSTILFYPIHISHSTKHETMRLSITVGIIHCL